MSKLTPRTKAGLRVRRHNRLRARVCGTAERPRLAVFRSNRFVYAQIIDDERGITLVGAAPQREKMSLLEQARAVGTLIAAGARQKNITNVVFDRGGFRYGGRVAALAEAARAGGLSF